MNILFTLNPKISTALSVLIGYLLIDDLSAQEQNVLGNWLMLTAQTIITNATSQQLIENYCLTNNNININSQNVKNNYSPLFYNINTLKEVISNIDPKDREIFINDLHNRIKKLEEIINNVHGK